MDNASKTKQIVDVNSAIEDVINIAIQGHTEQEAVFILHAAVREVDKYFDHLGMIESHSISRS
jgi:hypothetical protein